MSSFESPRPDDVLPEGSVVDCEELTLWSRGRVVLLHFWTFH